MKARNQNTENILRECEGFSQSAHSEHHLPAEDLDVAVPVQKLGRGCGSHDFIH